MDQKSVQNTKLKISVQYKANGLGSDQGNRWPDSITQTQLGRNMVTGAASDSYFAERRNTTFASQPARARVPNSKIPGIQQCDRPQKSLRSQTRPRNRRQSVYRSTTGNLISLIFFPGSAQHKPKAVIWFDEENNVEYFDWRHTANNFKNQ